MRIKNKRITIRKDALFMVGALVGFVLLSYGTGRVVYHLDPSTAVSEAALPATITYTGVGIAFLLIGTAGLVFGVGILVAVCVFLFEVEEIDQ